MAKVETLSPTGLLQPLLIPCQVWDDIAMDFIEEVPPSNGRSVIFMVIDHRSKLAQFITLSHPFSTKTIVERFMDSVVKLYGMPRSIIRD